MKIIDRIEEINTFLENNPEGGKAFARQLQLQAVDAIAAGLPPLSGPLSAWEAYMSNFASNEDQLKRLKGQDSFIDNVWGKEALCYMVANSTCTMGTTTDTGRLFDDDMRDALDQGMPIDEDESFLKKTDRINILQYM